MSEKEYIVKLDKCFKCRLNKADKCEGQYAVKGSVVVVCPYYVDYRDEGTNIEKAKVPFEKTSKRVKKIQK
jgi:NAD-dependent dihydropyrimidine dehydrogenase PreA subunit